MAFARLDYDIIFHAVNSQGAPMYNRDQGTTYSSFFPSTFALSNSGGISPQLPTPYEVATLEKSKQLSVTEQGIFSLSEIKNLDTDSVISENELGAGNYSATYDLSSQEGTTIIEATVTYTFSVVQNRLPIKKWTITDVINRCCDLIKPLRLGEAPKFRLQGVNYNEDGTANTTYLQGSQAEYFDKILSPEFAFTKMTFREQLKQVGGYIHGEPRITGEKVDEYGRKYFEFKYDMFLGDEVSNISKRNYVSILQNTDINEYCTALDSSADNLVNQLDYAQGVIVEPFENGSISLRTENTTLRLEENDNTVIQTTMPIYAVGSTKRVYCTYIEGLGVGKWDITPYIYEKADYDLLSSYTGNYPFAKSYALYYTQGQKNIKGLFFKPAHYIDSSFSQYAIKNILEQVTGQALSLSGQNYMKLQFRVTYLPLYSTRVTTNKAVILGGLPRTLAYNQGANIVESRYYGENLKGVVARLGNVQKSYTYHLAFLSDIPKIGMKFIETDKDGNEDEFYISAVSVQVLADYISCTVSLSKDFNRLSQYVGINSEKRMWEVSEKQAVNRQTIINDYIVVAENEYPFGTQNGEPIYVKGNPLFSPSLKWEGGTGATPGICNILFNNTPTDSIPIEPVTMARVQTFTKKQIPNTVPIYLPVISGSFGNTMSFTFGFADNYSAGQKSVYKTGVTDTTGNGQTTGYFGDYVPYSDYYGRYYYIALRLLFGNGYNLPNDFSFTLPQATGEEPTFSSVVDTLNTPITARKDSREIPQITYQLTTVAKTKGLIIGSGLASYCGLVRNDVPSFLDYELYVCKKPINSLDRFLDIVGNRDYRLIEMADISGGTNPVITFDEWSITINKLKQNLNLGEYKSWVIVTKVDTQDIQVENEDGEEVTQTIQTGGEVVIAKNGQLPVVFDENEPITLNFGVTSDIYE